MTKAKFDELAFDLDQGASKAATVEEVRAALAAQRAGLIGPGELVRGTQGADFVTPGGEQVDIKAYRPQSLSKMDARAAGKFLVKFNDPRYIIVIDTQSLTDAELQTILQRARDIGAPMNRIRAVPRQFLRGPIVDPAGNSLP